MKRLWLTPDIDLDQKMSEIVQSLSVFVRKPIQMLFSRAVLRHNLLIDDRKKSLQGEASVNKKVATKLWVSALAVSLVFVPAAASFADDAGEIVFVGFVDNAPPPSNQFPPEMPDPGPPLVSGDVVDPAPSEPSPTNTPPAPTVVEPVYTIQEQPVESSVSPAQPPTLSSAPVSAPRVTTQTPVAAAKPIEMPIKPGSLSMTPSVKAVLAKTAAKVKSSNKPVTIAISSAGVTQTQATNQAKALIAELKKMGATAVTKVTKVAGKNVVTVVVSKAKR
jgi:hypothetical protein